MRGCVENGQIVTGAPATDFAPGDLVLCRQGAYLVRCVKARLDRQLLIENSLGQACGSIETGDVCGKVVDVESPPELISEI